MGNKLYQRFLRNRKLMMRRNAQQSTIYQEEKSSSERATNSTIQVPKNKKQKNYSRKEDTAGLLKMLNGHDFV